LATEAATQYMEITPPAEPILPLMKAPLRRRNTTGEAKVTYSLDRGLFVENGPAELAAAAAESRPAVRFLPWRKLNADHRLRAVEEALRIPANDVADGFPLAL
jgi:hypothetical protein